MKVLFLFALVLNLSLLGIQVAASQCTNGNGILQNSYCNCYAGYAPDYTQGADNCLNSISCSTGNADDSLISGYYAPTLLDSNTPVKFDHDRVIISFVQPATQMPWHRRETYISFYAGASSTGTAGDLSCQYPGSLWTKVLQPSPSCKDVYTFSMPFNRAASCGFQKAVTPSTITYTTTVKFSYIEVSDTSATNSRSLSNLFTINIQLVRQTAITAALNLNLASTSDATVDAFVIGTSAYDLLSAKTRVLFQTHTSWPYQIGSALTVPAVLDGPTVTIHPVGTNAEISPDYLTPDNCPQVAGASCVQQFEIVVSRADPALCDFQGTYVVDTQLVCVDTDSCTPATGPQITITLDSKNICTPPVVDTGVSTTQSLLSFNDAGLSNTQTDFETGDTSYWTFTIVDPNVSIDSVILNTVVLSLVDNPEQLDPDYIIRDKVETITGVVVEPHNAVNVVHPPGTPVVVSFGLVLNRGKLPNTVQTLGLGDSIKSINLAVIVDVQYHGNKKRTIQAVVSPASNGGAASTAAFVVRSKEYSQAIGKQSNKGSDCSGLCSFAKGVMGALGF